MDKMRPFMSNQGLSPEEAGPVIPQAGKEYGTNDYLPNGKQSYKKTYDLKGKSFTGDNPVIELDNFSGKFLVGTSSPSYVIKDLENAQFVIPGGSHTDSIYLFTQEDRLYLEWIPNKENSPATPSEPGGDNNSFIIKEGYITVIYSFK